MGALALLSRLQPSWFPRPSRCRGCEARLAYPVNYWNGLAALIAIGIPLILTLAAESRRLMTQAVATGLPVMALTTYLTLSRGGVIEVAVALIVLARAPPAPPRTSSVVRAWRRRDDPRRIAAGQRSALADNLRNATSASQGHEMLAVALAVCTGVGLLRFALELAGREALWPTFWLPRRPSRTVIAGLAASAMILALVGGAPG